MPFVLDASIALSWLFKEERTKRTVSLLRRVADDGAVIPSLWHYEVSSGLLLGIRRKRLRPATAKERLQLLIRLQLELEPHLPSRFISVLELAEEMGLTTYDASYLELAMRRGLPLATDDADLAKAARAKKVALL